MNFWYTYLYRLGCLAYTLILLSFDGILMSSTYKPLDSAAYKPLGLGKEFCKKWMEQQAMQDAARSGLPNEALSAEIRAMDAHVEGVGGVAYTSLQRSRVVRRGKSNTDPHTL